MRITSPAFEDSGDIPRRFTCQGENINPQLDWTEVPSGTMSLALIMEDPDVPRNLRPDGLFIHWMVWNIAPTVQTIAENSEPSGVAGQNSSGAIGYRGPCPPDRMHRYYFRLYALDCELTLDSGATKGELLRAMDGHTVAMCELMGRYEKTAE